MQHRDVLPTGTILDGKYRIDRLIGAGGFGMTYVAHDIGLNQQVAVKEYYPAQFGMRDGTLTVRPRSGNDSDIFHRLKESFLREARTLAQLRHPCIVRVLSVFEGHGTAYMIMEFEAGKSLKSWLDGLGRKPTQDELDRLVMPLLDALELMHAASFLHRDIAPDNIIVRADGGPVLLDFGAARRVMAELSGALTGIVKQGYSPQEQYANDPRAQGPWSDIYALGATLYRCVAGQTPTEATLRMLDDPTVPASEIGEGKYRAGFLAAIDQSMRVRPRERPQSIAQLRQIISSQGPIASSHRVDGQSAIATVAVPTKSDGWSKVGVAKPEPAASVVHRSGGWKIGAAIASVLVFGGMAWGMYGYSQRQAIETARVEAERLRRAGDVKDRTAVEVENARLEAQRRKLAEIERSKLEDAERLKLEALERLKREQAARKSAAPDPGGQVPFRSTGDKIAVALDNVFGPCPFCDDVRKLVSADEFAQFTGLADMIERTWADVRERKGPLEDAKGRQWLEKLVSIKLEPDPVGALKPGRAKCTTYHVGFLDNAVQRVGQHTCEVRTVQIGGETVSLTVEKTTGDGFHANLKKYRVNAMAYLGRTYLKGHAITRYNLARPKNAENGNFGNKVGLLISIDGTPALISMNQNGFTEPDVTFFEIMVLEP